VITLPTVRGAIGIDRTPRRHLWCGVAEQRRYSTLPSKQAPKSPEPKIARDLLCFPLKGHFAVDDIVAVNGPPLRAKQSMIRRINMSARHPGGESAPRNHKLSLLVGCPEAVFSHQSKIALADIAARSPRRPRMDAQLTYSSLMSYVHRRLVQNLMEERTLADRIRLPDAPVCLGWEQSG